MKAVAEQLKLSITDYLEGELISEIKHEYINGDIYAMAGAKRVHNLVSMNLSAALYNHLQGSPCRVFASDMKVGIQTDTEDYFYYPDLHVSCEQAGNTHFNSQPKLIIEILSDSTERKDRAEKFHNYRKLNSLEDYVLVAQDCQRVEIYSRSQAWDLALFTQEGDVLRFESVGLNLALVDIYQDVEFD
ncbi:MAG: Uma2 family endonuclease [Methylococcales bacterium]|nr:Uma2 family endonuclease [Methylococcales bacterium]